MSISVADRITVPRNFPRAGRLSREQNTGVGVEKRESSIESADQISVRCSRIGTVKRGDIIVSIKIPRRSGDT